MFPHQELKKLRQAQALPPAGHYFSADTAFAMRWLMQNRVLFTVDLAWESDEPMWTVTSSQVADFRRQGRQLEDLLWELHAAATPDHSANRIAIGP